MARKAAASATVDDVIDDGVVDEPVEQEQQLGDDELGESQELENQEEGEVQEDGEAPEDVEDIEYEVDVPDGAGGVSTETIKLAELPDILAGARRLYDMERQLVAREADVKNVETLVDFVRKDNLTRMVTQYRLEGHSEFEVAEAVYNWYLQNGEAPSQDEDDSPQAAKIRELEKKLQSIEQERGSRQFDENRRENNEVLSKEWVKLGFTEAELNRSDVMEAANAAATEVFLEIAPNIDPNTFTAVRKVTPRIAQMVWNATMEKLGSRLKKPGETKQQPSVRMRQMQAAAQGANVNKPAIRQAPGKVGMNPVQKRENQKPAKPKGNIGTARDRASDLRELFHGR